MKNIKSFENGLRIEPRSASAISQEGELEVQNNSLRVYVQAAARILATTDQTQTLTNKSMSGSSNTFTNIPFSAFATLPSAQIIVGNASNIATAVAVSGQATISNAGVITLDNASVIGKVLTGYTSGAGTVAATDTILQAIQKLNGNTAAIGTPANTSLSNLSSVAVNQSLVPDADNNRDLGEPANRWGVAYVVGVGNAEALVEFVDDNATIKVGTAGGLAVAEFDATVGLSRLNATDASVSVDAQNRQLKSGATSKLDWSGATVVVNPALTLKTSLIVEDPGAGTNTVTIAAPAALAASYALTLPVDDGASGEFLSTNGSGVLSWADAIPNATTALQPSPWWADDTYGIRAIAGDAEILANGDVYVFGTTQATDAAMTSPYVLFETGGNVGNLGGATAQSGGIQAVTGSVDGTANSGEISYSSGTTVDGTSGAFAFASGAASGTGGSGGISFNTGTTGAGNSGSIQFQTGSVGAGIRGNITFLAEYVDITPADYVAISDNKPLRFRAGADYVGFKAPATIAASVDWELPDQDGGVGQYLKTDGAGVLSWDSPAGSGDVVGPASAVDSEVALFDGVTGKLIKRASATGVAKLASGVLSASNVNLTSEVTGVLPLANGGTNKNMTAVNGGLVYIDADSMEVTAAGTAGQVIISAGSSAPTWGTDVIGVATNSNAAAGYKGEYQYAEQTTLTAFPTTNQYGDGASITLTAGDWLITGGMYGFTNGGTVTSYTAAISSTSGNSTTGITIGTTGYLFQVASVDASPVVVPFRVSISGSTTYYLKVRAVYSLGTPQYRCNISAWRIR